MQVTETDTATNEEESEWPSVSLLILNWNGRALLESCLPPLLRLDYPAYEVVVVDNGSTDDSVAYVRAHFPSVRLLETGENLGFSRGMNFGMRRVEGEVVVLLNNDVTILGEDWLHHLVRPLQATAEIGITGGKLLFPDRETIQHAGAFLAAPLAYSRHTGHGETDRGQYDEARDVPYVTGAAMAIARRVLDTIGLLDEQFHPFYYEEVDFCWRARVAGYRVRYVPAAVALHDESFSLRQASQLQYYTYQRNRLRFVLKHYPLATIQEEFFPAERARLRAGVAEKVLVAERDVYLEAARALPQILAARGESAVRAELQAALLDLRQTALAQVRTAADAQAEAVASLDQHHTLEEFKFPADTPLIGSLVAAVREQWHAIAAKWALRHVRQQQQHFNFLLVRLLRTEAAANITRDEQIQANAADLDSLLQEVLTWQQTMGESVAAIEKQLTTIDKRLQQLERAEGERPATTGTARYPEDEDGKQ